MVMELINEGIVNPTDYKDKDLDDWVFFLRSIRSKGVTSTLRTSTKDATPKSKIFGRSLNSSILDDKDQKITVMV